MANWLGNDADDKWQMWLYGVAAPLPVTALALFWIIGRRADLHDPKTQTVLLGTDAVALGVTALFLALALHFHFFWRLNPNTSVKQYHAAGRTLSLVGTIISLLYLTWCFIRLCFLS